MSTLSLNVIHIICNRLLLFLSGRRFMPNTRFLSMYSSEFVWRIGVDAVEHGRGPRDRTSCGNAELAASVTLSKSAVPSNVVSSMLNPLELSVRKPSTRPCNPPQCAERPQTLWVEQLGKLPWCEGEWVVLDMESGFFSRIGSQRMIMF